MKETRADTSQAFIASVLLHALFFALVYFGLHWTKSMAPVNPAGPIIEAELIDPNALSAAMRRTLASRPDQPAPAPPEEVEAAPPEQPRPEPLPEEEPVPPQPAPQERVPEPDTRDQEEARPDIVSPKPPAEREQEERRRQEQIDLTEREKQAEAERKQRLREQLDEIRKEREAAERRTKMEEQRLQQLADAQAKPPAPTPQPAREPVQAGGNNGTDTDLAARYALAMHQTAQAGWNRALAPERVACRVRFTQIPGGDVIDVQFLSCGFDAQGRESVERALRRSPMPYAGFEPVFQRQIDLTFCYPEEACPR